MRPIIDPAIIALTGSETRALTLAPVSNASAPMSAYKLAKIIGLPRSKVYRELRRLSRAGIMTESAAPDGTALWWVEDPDIRQLFRRRARIGWSDDLVAEAPGLESRTRDVLQFALNNPVDVKLLKRRSSPRNPAEFDRVREKTELLRKLGLKTGDRSSGRR